MSPLLEIVIEPEKSQVYFRLISVLYTLSAALIVYSSLYVFIKIILIGFFVILMRLDWINKSPCPTLSKIQFIANQWVLKMKNGREKPYTHATILISTPYFLLIQFTHPNRKSYLVLFHDQLTYNQLRFLHLKTAG